MSHLFRLGTVKRKGSTLTDRRPRPRDAARGAKSASLELCGFFARTKDCFFVLRQTYEHKRVARQCRRQMQFNGSQHERLNADAGVQGLIKESSFDIALHFQTVRNIKLLTEAHQSPLHRSASNSALISERRQL
jgi:hypothetical protein